MPALPLSHEELEEKRRLKEVFEKWQNERKASKEKYSQGFVANTFFDMTQPAFSQYLKGKAQKQGERDGIPLNADFLAKFCRLVGINPKEISPRLANEMRDLAESINHPIDARHNDSDNEYSAERKASELNELPISYQSEFTNIRRFDLRASAGEGRLVFDYDALEPFKIRSDFLKKNGASEKNTFFMTAKGDSMEPIIPDGADVLVVENGHEIINGKVYVFFLNKNIYIKSLSKTEGGIVALSYNHAYDPMFIGPKDSFKIIGRVIMCSFVL